MEAIKKILKDLPTAKWRRKKMRDELTNRSFSFLTPNCLGGILTHDLGLRFLSPTVNLMMTQTDFLKFVLYLKEYVRGQLEFYDDKDYTCPCAWLKAEGLAPICVHFTHYKTEEDARTKWFDRIRRIDYDNLFILIEERDGLTKEDIASLAAVHARGVLAFTAHPYEDIPFAVFLPRYQAKGEVGNILRKNYFDDSREYEQYFDFVKWFNEASGGDYNVQRFVK